MGILKEHKPMDKAGRIKALKTELRQLENPPRSKSIKPHTIKVFDSLLRSTLSPFIEYRLRIVRFPHSAELFDIRKWIKSETYVGYEDNGTSLDLENTIALYNKLPTIIAEMEALRDERIKPITDSISEAPKEVSRETETA